MTELLLDILSWLLLVTGGLVVIIGGIGLLRLPDFFCRLHAASLPDTLGVLLIVVGLMLQAGWTLVTAKLAFILLFIFFTGPTSTHALAKTALGNMVKPLLSEQGEKS